MAEGLCSRANNPPDRFDEVLHRLKEVCVRLTTLENRSSSPPPSPGPRNPMVTVQRYRLQLDIPRFEGHDPHGWLFKITQFFEYHLTPMEERITVASFYLDGLALAWYQWMYENNQLISWDQFVPALETRFAPTVYDDHKGKLFKLSQTSDVSTYLHEFESLANRVEGLPPPFLNGRLPWRLDHRQIISPLQSKTLLLPPQLRHNHCHPYCRHHHRVLVLSN